MHSCPAVNSKLCICVFSSEPIALLSEHINSSCVTSSSHMGFRCSQSVSFAQALSQRSKTFSRGHCNHQTTHMKSLIVQRPLGKKCAVSFNIRGYAECLIISPRVVFYLGIVHLHLTSAHSSRHTPSPGSES